MSRLTNKAISTGKQYNEEKSIFEQTRLWQIIIFVTHKLDYTYRGALSKTLHSSDDSKTRKIVYLHDNYLV